VARNRLGLFSQRELARERWRPAEVKGETLSDEQKAAKKQAPYDDEPPPPTHDLLLSRDSQ
jgi:hypothetical protein